MKVNPSSVLASINLIQNCLNEANLLRDWNPTAIEYTNIVAEGGKKKKVSRVTWSVNVIKPDILEYPDSTLEEYIKLVENRNYNFLLVDGSVLQFTYDIDRHDNVLGCRLVWYPCPVKLDPGDLDDFTIEEIISGSPPAAINCRAPIRVDFSPAQIANNHSCTHLHLGMENFRLPVHRALEPCRFVRLIIRSAYPSVWASTELFRNVENWASVDRMDDDDRQFGYLSWMAG